MNERQLSLGRGILRAFGRFGAKFALRVSIMIEVEKSAARWVAISFGPRRRALMRGWRGAGRGRVSGQTMVEYSLLVGLIAVSLIVAVSTFGDEVVELYDYIVSEMGPALGGS